jgi:hypothetical protein
LIVNVPNFASWQSRFAGRVWFHLDPPRHLVHFMPETLAAILGGAGVAILGGHPKPAIDGHLKTGHHT